MSAESSGPVQIDGTTLRPWDVFERHVAAYLSTMFAPEETDSLTLHGPDPAGGEPWVIRIRTVDAGQGIRVSYPWDDTGGHIDGSQDLAWRLRAVLEDRLRVAHPQLITVEAAGPASRGVGMLALQLHGEDPADVVAPEEKDKSRHEHLLDALLRHTQTTLDPSTELDDDGDIPLLVDGVRLWVKVHEGEPATELFTPVVDEVSSPKRAALELAVVNRRYAWSRWTYSRGTVWQRLFISPTSLSLALFDEMLEAFVLNHHDVTDDLVDRLEGTAALS